MGSVFNQQILTEKLVKLNSSQQSIETLSHWCIFHMNKAKLVVESWEKQFHCAPREQKLAYLYLANDILQNSRRKGADFVAEFWRVLPEALHDVIRNGDDAERNAARRLINIWDERKVFGSRGHILKEEFMDKQPGNSDRNRTQSNLKLKQPVGDVVDKIISDYEIIYGGELDEDALLSRCTTTHSTLEKIVKDFSNGVTSGNVTEELQVQHASLKQCIEQLTTLESSRAVLVSHLRDALQEQESKLDQVRGRLQAAQLQSDQATNIYQQLVNSDNVLLDGQGSSVPTDSTPGGRQTSPIAHTKQPSPLATSSASFDDNSRKSAAADMVAKLTASTSSAEMLSLVLSSLVSGDYQLEKRAKLENDPSPPPPQPPQIQQPPQTLPSSLPPQPSLPPLMPPYPMSPEFIQTTGSMSNMAYTNGPPPQLPGYPSVEPSMTRNVTEELQVQHASLKQCIEELATLESSRAVLVSHLRDALQEQLGESPKLGWRKKATIV